MAPVKVDGGRILGKSDIEELKRREVCDLLTEVNDARWDRSPVRTEVDSTLPATATKMEWVEKRKMKGAWVQMDESKEIEGRSL
ncbi:hypothetical protein COLO4_02985 [Corchorus olitorius]|uniref:Uncharacterized protein n=1 Tax=Corchorus olitorius TaxID=93759 RepID=A0A1R3KZT7_9ROSI|nr:hypothetical protein COLO4_02985 [Corchorus olitorius]